MTNSTGSETTVPAFPMRAVVIGILAMVAIAIASATTTWIVGQRIRTITQSQIAVLLATERLQHQSELLELSAQIAIATGEEAYARRYGAIQPELRRTLTALRDAIQLPENRTAFASVDAAERQISATEYAALNLAVAGRGAEARALLASPRYQELVRDYRSGLSPSSGAPAAMSTPPGGKPTATSPSISPPASSPCSSSASPGSSWCGRRGPGPASSPTRGAGPKARPAPRASSWR
jgi:hypothetical protein